MWVLTAQTAKPEVAYWPGRYWLAAIDAIGWPTLWGIVCVSFSTRTVGRVALSFLVLSAARRLHTAIFRNKRYWFTIRRWGLSLVGLLALGAATKLLP